MKKTTLFKTMLLLCALVVGSGNLWGQAAVNTVLWSEDFSGYSANGVPSGDITNSHTGTSVYGGATVTYSCTNGDSDTKVYTSGGPSGGSGNNLLVGKNNGSFTISGIPTGDAAELTIEYVKGGKGTLSLTTNTTGASISGSTLTTGGAETITLVFANTASGDNYRIDNISVKVKTAGAGTGIAAPTFSVDEGAVSVGTEVELEQKDSYTIRYTTDGTAPTKTTGTVYSDPIVINTPTTIKAIAVNGDDVSSVSTATYTINVPKPTFDVKAGAVYVGTPLTISATDGYTIIYTTDGTDPSYAGSNGDIYDSPIAINSAMTVKAIAVDGYDNESDITSAAYTVTYPSAVDITPNYTFYGKDSSFSGETTFDEVTGTSNGITVTLSKGTNKNLYANNTSMRFYKGNNLQIDAPSGKKITNIIFTLSSGTDDMTSTPLTYITSTHTWTGDATSITFTRSNDSYLQFTKITVVLAPVVTVGARGYATYCNSEYALDFTGKSIKAYTISSTDGSALTLTQKDKVAKEEAVLLYSETPDDSKTIPVIADAAATATIGNKLVQGDGTTALTWVETTAEYYVLATATVEPGFYRANGNKVATTKAYLDLTGLAAEAHSFILDLGEGETTGIANVNANLNANNNYFDLQGRKVAQPTKGLYIVNGKKVIIK